MLRLMIVEDEALVALDLRDMAEELGHEVLWVASSIDAAIGHLNDSGQRPQAVILDANLSGHSAAPVAQRLRELHIPFVMSTGYNDQELRRVGINAPTLTKPYRTAQLRRALDRLTSDRGQ